MVMRDCPYVDMKKRFHAILTSLSASWPIMLQQNQSLFYFLMFPQMNIPQHAFITYFLHLVFCSDGFHYCSTDFTGE